jgi:hypothetical protein
MRLMNVVLFLWLVPVSGAFCAGDSGDRGHPADDSPLCLDRGTDSARGGCLTNEAGALRNIAPQPLPPEQNTDRQPPPSFQATLPIETPGTQAGERIHPADDIPICRDRDTNSARGGCITNESGKLLNVAPQRLLSE